jgi:5-methylcytosine-specific restriction endonuclease McrA
MASSFQEYKWRRTRLWELGLTLGEYPKYLASPHWQQLRRQKLDEQRNKLGYNCCEECGDRPAVTKSTAVSVHHPTYERLGKEQLQDLKIICRPCHDKEHGRDEATQRRYYGPSVSSKGAP